MRGGIELDSERPGSARRSILILHYLSKRSCMQMTGACFRVVGQNMHTGICMECLLDWRCVSMALLGTGFCSGRRAAGLASNDNAVVLTSCVGP